MGLRKMPRGSPRTHIWSAITHPDPLLNRSCATLRDVNDQYKDPFLSVRGPFPGPPKAPTWKPSGACYSCVTYSWIARFLRFADPAMPPDHPHILNITTPYINAGCYE